MTQLARHYLVTGKVQRVYFRQSTLTEAETLGITGWVRNLPDGRVEVSAFGSPQALERFESWLQVGPKMAQVEKVDSVKPPAGTSDSPPISFTLLPTPTTDPVS
ncbi:MAG: acylphosphatase [Immundisolibacteraceae bacterium]|nr:acylphosphatase [Immundisolibacteraceae bacterium]